MLLRLILAFLRRSRSDLCVRDEETENFFGGDSFAWSHTTSIWESWGLNPGLLTASVNACATTLQTWVIKKGPDSSVANDFLPGFHVHDVACGLMLEINKQRGQCFRSRRPLFPVTHSEGCMSRLTTNVCLMHWAPGQEVKPHINKVQLCVCNSQTISVHMLTVTLGQTDPGSYSMQKHGCVNIFCLTGE